MSQTLSERLTIIVAGRFNGNWAEFARSVQLKPSTIQHIKSGGDLRLNTLTRISDKLNLSMDWLASGVGPMYREKPGGKIVIDASIPPEDLPKEQILVWVESTWSSLTPRQKVWFHEQFRQAFPEFDAWLSAVSSPKSSPQGS